MSVGKRFTYGAVSLILCLVLFILTCVFSALLLLRSDFLPLIIRDFDITEVLEDTEIAYYVVNQINSLPFIETEVDLYDIQEFIQTEAVSDELGNVFSEFTRALGTNDLEFHLSNNDVLRIVQNLEPEIYDLFDHRMTETDYMILTRTLDDILDFEGMTVSGLMYDVGIDIVVPRLLFSPFLLWGVAILIMITICIIFLVNSKSIPKAFLLIGIPIMISGFLYLIVGVIFSTYPDMLSGTLHTLSRLTGAMMHLVIRCGIVMTAIGATSIIVSLILGRRQVAQYY